MTFKWIDEYWQRGQRLFQRTIQQREEAQVVSHTTISTISAIHHKHLCIISNITTTSTSTITSFTRMTQGLVEELWDLLQGLMSSARCISLSQFWPLIAKIASESESFLSSL